MNALELLIQAINNKKSISFEYNKVDKEPGIRIGDPYAVFIFTAKNTKIQSTKVHIVQTAGVSDSKEVNPFPSFRMYNIEDLTNLKVSNDSFIPNNEKYNAEWEGYIDVIAKI